MKKAIGLTVLIFCFHFAISQVSGPTSVTVGQSTSYTYNDFVVYNSFNWGISGTGTGTVTNSTRSGTTCTGTITWTGAGAATVTFLGNFQSKGSISVTASCPSAPPVPNAAFTYPNGTTGCGSVTITYTTSPPSGMVWYWQSSPTSTSTVNSTKTFAAPSSGTSYLRANCGSFWSAAQATSAVTVKTLPTVSGGNSVCSGTPISITLTNNLASTLNTWTNSTSLVTGATNGSATSGASSPFTCSFTQTLSTTTTSNGTATYNVVPSANGCTGASTPVTVTVKAPPIASAANQTIFSGQTTSISLSSTIAGSTYSYTVAPVNVSNATSGSSSPIAQTLSCADGINAGNAVYSVAANASGCPGPSVPITVFVYPPPVISSPSNRLAMGPVILSTGSYDSYMWKNSIGTVVGTTPTFSATLPGNYTVVVLKNGVSSPPSPPYQVLGQYSGQVANYIISYDVLVDGIAQGISPDALPPESISQTVQYFDGLGRPLQTVSTKASPAKNDLVQPFVYDGYAREYAKYLPFTYNNPNSGWLNANIFSSTNNYAGVPNYSGVASNFYQSNPSGKIANDAGYFNVVAFEQSPLMRPLTELGPGFNWYPNHFVSHGYYVNLDGNLSQGQEKIINWTITSAVINSQTSYLATQNGFWPANSFNIKVTADENANQVREYVDRQGRTLVKKVQNTSTPNTYDDTQWTITYYVYDDFDRLRIVLPPEFNTRVATYNTSTQQVQSTMLAAWAFQYNYDQRGRMATKQLPGAGPTAMVYDQWDRLILTQTAIQSAAQKWSFTKYDVFDRAIILGEFTNSKSPTDIVSDVNLVTVRFEKPVSGGTIGYTVNQTYPTGVLLSDIQHVSFYDDYSFKTNLALGSAYDFAVISGYPGAPSIKTRNQLTGTMVKAVMPAATKWLVTATYYDDRHRSIQIVSDDHLGNKNRTTNVYSGITNWITKSMFTHGASLLVSVSETDFDHKGRPTKTYLTMDPQNSGQRIITSSLKYNELGQVIEKNLHSADLGATYLQSIDYRYNIKGWSTSINNSTLSNDGVTNDDTNDVFGMQMNYDQSATLNGAATNAQFNGNISSMQWGTNNLTDPVKQKIYGFLYDPANRVLQSNYASYNGVGWNGDGNMYNENVSYDKNGNILLLNRNSLFNGVVTAIDQLSYAYTSGNQLSNVTDNSPYWNQTDANPDYGFTELMNSPTTEYGYDGNGNLQWDGNAGITNINYSTYLNKPTVVTLGNSDPSKIRSVYYAYDASGTKLNRLATKGSSPGTNISQTDYVGSIQYEGTTGNTSLAFMMMPEGRVVRNGSIWNYEYFLKDHLGNTRSVVAYTNKIDEYSATMEPVLASKEESLFQNLPASRVQMGIYNHTPKNYLTPAPDRVAETNGYTSKPIGPAKFMTVKSGDQINAQVYAQYTTGTGSSTAVITNLFAALSGAYGLTSGEASYTAFNNDLPVIAGGLTANSSVPKSYLIYILFKNDYSSYQFGYKMVSINAQTGPELLNVSVTVPAAYDNGNLYIYVANESNVPAASSVYFDDMYIRNIEAAQSFQVTQVKDYYPFGLAINPLAYQKSTTYPNKYQYNGKELQSDFSADPTLNFSLNWLDYGARMYMPSIARWGAVDPLAEKMSRNSPYTYALDNPIRFLDNDGMKPSPAEAVAMSAHVYGDKAGSILLGGWKVSTREFGIIKNSDNGLKSQVYERTTGGKTEYTYATAGTENGTDWKQNGLQAVGASTQYAESMGNASQISEQLKETGSELTFTGHSLGGGEAAANAYATGHDAITFNAAGVSPLTTTENSNVKIDAFVLTTDPLHILQNEKGGAGSLMPDTDGEMHDLHPTDIASVINGHSIDNVLKSFGIDPSAYPLPKPAAPYDPNVIHNSGDIMREITRWTNW